MVKATTSAPSQRMLRVGEMVRAAVTKILQRDEIRDPDVEGVVITVSEVRMSPDLKIANAYVKALGQDDQKNVLKGLNRSAKFVRKRLGPELSHMKYMPEVRFRDDTSFDNYNRIDQLLSRPEVLRDLEQPDIDEPSNDGQPDDNEA
ncbi:MULTISPECIES: 30S ribosome-binding factor RbfA [unclassified Lentilitoribacter]|jgi:ribosome-binding factor A|uniref:30S ribosome-binding factor RbfA n=1 Tax=unclassified Lentilitoribacter TaxID=2647570 RepID=UPI0013A70BF2|nr:30S ribosome-binding factor RbfA [Lentilitoribacter sp. Alg239-R112]